MQIRCSLTGNHKMFAEMAGINLRKSILKQLKQVNHMIKVVQDYGENIENERKDISFVCTIQCSRSLEGKRGYEILRLVAKEFTATSGIRHSPWQCR